MPLREGYCKKLHRSNLDDAGRRNIFACFITAFKLCCILEAKRTNKLSLSFLEGGKVPSNLSKGLVALQMLFNKEMLLLRIVVI